MVVFPQRSFYLLPGYFGMNDNTNKFALGDIVRYKGFELQTGFIVQVQTTYLSYSTKDQTKYRICWFDHHGVDSFWYNGLVLSLM